VAHLKNKLEGLTKLPHIAAVYVPTTVGKKTDAQRGKDTALYVGEEMAKIFGGYTITKALGGWYSDTDGELIQETIFIVRSNSESMTQLEKNMTVNIAQYVKDWHLQEAVSIEIDGTLYLV
jgi:hypothetical protein